MIGIPEVRELSLFNRGGTPLPYEKRNVTLPKIACKISLPSPTLKPN
jgi:hypothetical protein